MEANFFQELEQSTGETLLRVGKRQSRAEKAALLISLGKCSKKSIAKVCEVIVHQTAGALAAFKDLHHTRPQGGRADISGLLVTPLPYDHVKSSSAVLERDTDSSSVSHVITPQQQSASLTTAETSPLKTPSPPKRGKRRKLASKQTSSHLVSAEGSIHTSQLETNPAGQSSKVSTNQEERTPLLSKVKSLQDHDYVIATLGGCVLVCQTAISLSQRTIASGILFPAVLGLHDALVNLEGEILLQDSIATLCETWWHDGLPGRESLIAQSLPFLLSKSLDSGRKGDVRRIYGMREALTLLDFRDESIDDLKRLLIKAVITPLYLRVGEGRRFIAFLFGLDEQLVKELLVIVRSQIPFGRRSILEAYGEILYRAWKAATGDCLYEIEHSGIQGLIEGALYASTKSLGAAVRTVLEGFTSQRTERGVEAMLFRLHEPLLFRALQVANSNVRRNALLLLVDVFPLQDPEACKEDKEALLQKQFILFDKLLLDLSPEVRSVAVEGVLPHPPSFLGGLSLCYNGEISD